MAGVENGKDAQQMGGVVHRHTIKAHFVVRIVASLDV